MNDSVVVFLIRQLSLILQALPHRIALAIGRFFGLLFSKIHYRRRIAYANLKAAFGDKFSARERKKIVARHFLNLAQNVVEVLRFPKLSLHYFSKYISVTGREHYEALARKNQGTLLIMPHFGNWELSQILSALVGKPLHVLARQQKHSPIDDFLNELRSSHGSTTIYKGGALRELIRVLRQGGMVGVLGDLSGGREGTKVQFFGRKTTAPFGIFEIAERTNAAVLPCFMIRLDGGPHHQVFVEEIFPLAKTKDGNTDIPGSVQNYYHLLEKWIRKYPDQWFWMYKRWKHCFTKKVLILKDECAGHANQSESIERELKQLNQRLDGNYDFEFKSVHVQFKSMLHKKLFYVLAFFFLPFAQGRLRFLRFFLTPDCAQTLEHQFADIIISAGSSLVPLNLLLKKENLAKSVVIMKPSFPYSPEWFDLSILPMHDQLKKASNSIVRTLIALNKVEEGLLETAAKKFSGQILPKTTGRKRISIFIGGPSKSYDFNRDEFQKWIRELKICVEKQNYELLITTSRRTSHGISEIVKNEFSKHPMTKLLVIANEANIEGVTYGMLAHSDIAMITEDSVSMISEAVSAGKQVLVLQIGNGKLPKKHNHFHELLEENKLIHLANASNFYSKLTSANGTTAREVMKNQSMQIQEALRKLL